MLIELCFVRYRHRCKVSITALLFGFFLTLSPSPLRLSGCRQCDWSPQLWNGKIWRRYICHVSPTAWPDDEVCCPRYHGWYHCCQYDHSWKHIFPSNGIDPYSFPVDLWSRRRCPYFRFTYAVPLPPPSFIFTYSTTSGSWNVTRGIIHLPRRRSLGRSCRSCCRFRNRYRRWRRCPRNCSTAQTFRRHGMSIYTQVCNRMRTLMDGYDRFWFSFSLKCWVFTDLSLRLLWTPRLTIWPVS